MVFDSDFLSDTMAASATYQIMSFVNEFMNMNANGINAKVEFQSIYVRMYVNLHADLGYVLPPPPGFSVPSPPPFRKGSSHCKPSRMRRRRRRAKTHRDSVQVSETFIEAKDVNEASISTEDEDMYNEKS